MVSKFLSSLWGRAREKGKTRDADGSNNLRESTGHGERRERQRPYSEFTPSSSREYDDFSYSPAPSSPWCSSSCSTSSPAPFSASLTPPPLTHSLTNCLTPPPSLSDSLLSPTLSSNYSTTSTTALSATAEDMQMKTAFALNWDLQFLGSFPISNIQLDHVSQRLERFRPAGPFKKVQLSVSLMGVRVSQEENQLMSHSLLRVCTVLGRASLKQVAYIALEPAGQTYRRLCHVFQTEEAYQVEEIESVLGNAFTAAAVARQKHNRATVPRPPMMTSTPGGQEEMLPATVPLQDKHRNSSSAFLSRLLGKGKENVIGGDDPKAKRRRRPVSAVFSNAIHRLSSTTSMATKRMSTADLPRRENVKKSVPYTVPEVPVSPLRNAPPLAEQEDTSSTGSSNNNTNNNRNSTVLQKSSSLVFDEKIGEYVYPVDECLESQLEQVAYFCKLPSRDTVLRNLLSQPEGAFVLRFSESKRKCLAMSMRVPHSHNPVGVSHYLIVRNEKGFRIKGFSKHFPSIQMLITHHSVMQEQLPCRLLFVQWNKADWRDQRELRDSKEARDVTRESKDREVRDIQHETIAEERSSHRSSKIYPEIDENRNTCFYDEQLMKRLEETPKRCSRQAIDNKRRSRFFDLEQV